MDLSNIINADILLIDIPFNELRKNNFKSQEKLILNNEKILKLSSIILFNGTSGAEHYICLIECSEKLYLYDDSNKSKTISLIGNYYKIINNELYTKKIYGLVYLKVEGSSGGKFRRKLLKKY